MTRKDLEDKFNHLKSDQTKMMQELQLLSVSINKIEGKLELLKELHDAIPELQTEPETENPAP